MSGASYVPSMTDEAVRTRTGRGWDEWFALIDAAGGMTAGHAAIARMLAADHGVDAWWSQSVTVEYERARGLRQVMQKCDGTFSANASRTLGVPAERAFAAWADPAERAAWLDLDPEVRRATEPRSLRLALADDTRVDVEVYPLPDGRCRVTVQHNRLADAEAAAASKAEWKARLGRLAERLA